MAVECPTCSDSFDDQRSMKIHHKLSHGESIMEELECDWCGSTFERLSHEVSGKGSAGRFCSDGCETEWRKNQTGPDAGGWSGGMVEIECDNCGQKDTYYPSKADGRRCCSFECWNELYSAEYSGENSPFWKENNEDRYGGSWEQRREEIVERDGFECCKCGMSREDHRDVYGFDIHVHHIVPKRKFDQDIDAHKDENLVTLCAQCHYNVEKLSVVEQKDRLK